MGEKITDLQSIDYRQLFAWTHLFRAFRIAIDVRKALLAGLALMAISGGMLVLSYLPFASESANFDQISGWPTQTRTGFEKPLSYGPMLAEDPLGTLRQLATNWQLVLKPLAMFVEPGRMLLNPRSTISEVAFAWTQLFWTLLVWAIFGGAITRMVAVEFAQDERISIRQAIKFSCSKLFSFFGAPLVPLAGIGFFWILGLLVGLVARVPFAGEIVVGIGYIVPLVFGFIMALILLGVAVGWPLMYAAISTEGTDALDGFSRTYSYVFGRPWQYLWYSLVAMVYGSVVIFFVFLTGTLTVYLTGWSLASGMGIDHVTNLSQASPALTGGPELFTDIGEISSRDLRPEGEVPGSGLAGIWLNLFALLIAGFVYSYFWTSSTIIYFLLRRADDGVELDEVYLYEGEEEDDLLPLVGVAAGTQTVIERPADGGKMTKPVQSDPDRVDLDVADPDINLPPKDAESGNG